MHCPRRGLRFAWCVELLGHLTQALAGNRGCLRLYLARVKAGVSLFSVSPPCLRTGLREAPAAVELQDLLPRAIVQNPIVGPRQQFAGLHRVHDPGGLHDPVPTEVDRLLGRQCRCDDVCGHGFGVEILEEAASMLGDFAMESTGCSQHRATADTRERAHT